MLEEAINLIKKQIEMYTVQEMNITTKARKKVVENRIKEQLRKEIQLRKYILSVLKKEATCLHCDKGTPKYCEECFQDLIVENFRLKAELLKKL